MDTTIENAILKQVIGAILDEPAGVYPKSFLGRYKERSDYQNGYNAGVMDSWKMIVEIMDDLGVSVLEGDNCIDAPDIEFL
jgi:hypothetical protein